MYRGLRLWGPIPCICAAVWCLIAAAVSWVLAACYVCWTPQTSFTLAVPLPTLSPPHPCPKSPTADERPRWPDPPAGEGPPAEAPVHAASRTKQQLGGQVAPVVGVLRRRDVGAWWRGRTVSCLRRKVLVRGWEESAAGGGVYNSTVLVMFSNIPQNRTEQNSA